MQGQFDFGPLNKSGRQHTALKAATLDARRRAAHQGLTGNFLAQTPVRRIGVTGHTAKCSARKRPHKGTLQVPADDGAGDETAGRAGHDAKGKPALGRRAKGPEGDGLPAVEARGDADRQAHVRVLEQTTNRLEQAVERMADGLEHLAQKQPARVGQGQRVVVDVAVAVQALRGVRVLDIRIGRQEAAQDRIVHPAIHMNQPQLVQVLVAGEAAVGVDGGE